MREEGPVGLEIFRELSLRIYLSKAKTYGTPLVISSLESIENCTSTLLSRLARSALSDLGNSPQNRNLYYSKYPMPTYLFGIL